MAAAVSGVAGFGGALLLLPLLTHTVGARAAVPLLTVAQRVGWRGWGADGGRPFFSLSYCRSVPKPIFSIIRKEERPDPRDSEIVPPSARPLLLTDRLDATAGAPLIAGNRIDVELDNAKARRWLVESIGRAQSRVHLQIY